MEDKFTAREVAVLVEDLRGEFRAVAEGLIPLREDMADVKNRLEKVEKRLTGVEDAVRVAIPSLTQRVARLETRAGF